MKACDFNPCNAEESFCDCEWGSERLPRQVATLCKEHANELWEMLNPLLKMNKAWYRIDVPGKIKGE